MFQCNDVLEWTLFTCKPNTGETECKTKIVKILGKHFTYKLLINNYEPVFLRSKPVCCCCCFYDFPACWFQSFFFHLLLHPLIERLHPRKFIKLELFIFKLNTPMQNINYTHIYKTLHFFLQNLLLQHSPPPQPPQKKQLTQENQNALNSLT